MTAVEGGGAVVLDPSSRRRNITVEFNLDGTPAHVPLSALARDVLDLAACVYIADELSSRDESRDHWTRDFDILVPVRDPPVWQAATASIATTLTILSGDSFSFRWVERTGIVASTRHRNRLSSKFDAVCLFSGGIDSLLGANALLNEGRRVLLVGHQADGTTASSQTRLFAHLRGRFGNRVSFLQCRVAQSLSSNVRCPLPVKAENSHRPRSFLFLGLAVAVASMCGADLVAIPENGLIGLNVPLQRSRFGTLSTRTAHPRFLLGFRDAVERLGLFRGVIRNPFMAQSKTDLLSALDPSLRAAVRTTVSCAKTGRVRWSGKKGILHCGFCVPCIYRRVAMMAAGLDSALEYENDVFRTLQSISPQRQADLRALVQFAKRTTRSNGAQRQLGVTAHGFFPPELLRSIGDGRTDSFAQLGEMTLRWSQDFLRRLNASCPPSARRLLAL